MANASLALAYAALILVDGGKDVSESNLATLVKAVTYHSISTYIVQRRCLNHQGIRPRSPG
jgi:hypothetical protein